MPTIVLRASPTFLVPPPPPAAPAKVVLVANTVGLVGPVGLMTPVGPVDPVGLVYPATLVGLVEEPAGVDSGNSVQWLEGALNNKPDRIYLLITADAADEFHISPAYPENVEMGTTRRIIGNSLTPMGRNAQ